MISKRISIVCKNGKKLGGCHLTIIKTWQLSFGKVMHFDNKNVEHEYTMELGLGGQPHIEKSLVERYLSLMV